MSFFSNFAAQGEDFNRRLTPQEKLAMSGFPNAYLDGLGFLGIGSIKPTELNCEHYHCVSAPVLVYNATDKKFLGTIQAADSSVDMMKFAWEKCESREYHCIYQGHFGATYNCIGWAMGITKWLDPNEVTSYIKHGFSREEAINKFIKDKSLIYKDSISVVDHIVEHLHATTSLTQPPENNSVAFFFDHTGACQHGARFIEHFNGNILNRWTSKLGSSIAISHELQDLTGNDSIYGNELHYATTGNTLSYFDTKNEL